MTFPAISMLRRRFGDAQIDIIARPWVSHVYKCHGAINNVLELSNGRGTKRWLSIFKDAKLIKGINYDIGILFPNSFESAFLFKLSNIPEIVGYTTDLRAPFLTNKISTPPDKNKNHEIFYYLSLIKRAFSIQDDEYSNRPLIEFRISNSYIKSTKYKLKRLGISFDKIFVGINPGAAYGPAKCWPVERYKELAKRLLNLSKDIYVLVFGTASENNVGREIRAVNLERVFNLCGKTTLMEAICTISMLNLMVTNDSGLMHIAAACNIPIVAIFGSTNPITTGPWSENAIIIRKELSCSPCLKRDCNKGFECMLGIEVKDVLKACKRHLKKLDL